MHMLVQLFCLFMRTLTVEGSHFVESLLKLSMLGKNFSADDILEKKNLIFSRKLALIYHANCLLKRQFAKSVKAYFLGKRRQIL